MLSFTDTIVTDTKHMAGVGARNYSRSRRTTNQNFVEERRKNLTCYRNNRVKSNVKAWEIVAVQAIVSAKPFMLSLMTPTPVPAKEHQLNLSP